MVRKLLVTLLAIGVIGGAGYFLSIPSLSYSIRLSDDGPDITGDVPLDIGRIIGSGSDGGISFAALEDAVLFRLGDRTFLQPGDYRIRAELLGNAELRADLSLARFQHVTREIVLDAALVNARIIPGDPDAVQFVLEYETDTSAGSAGQMLPAEGPAPLFLAAGTRKVWIGDGKARQALDVPIVAGQVSQATIDLRRADLDIAVQTQPPWPAGQPVALSWQIAGADGDIRAGTADSLALTIPDLAPGDYTLTLGLPDASGYGEGAIRAQAQVSAGASQLQPVQVSLPVPVVSARLDLAGWVAPADTALRFSVVETGYKGVPYGSADATPAAPEAAIVVAPWIDDAGSDFGVFAHARTPGAGESIVGYAPLGPLVPGTAQEVTVTLGAGHADCVTLYGAGDCASILAIP